MINCVKKKIQLLFVVVVHFHFNTQILSGAIKQYLKSNFLITRSYSLFNSFLTTLPTLLAPRSIFNYIANIVGSICFYCDRVPVCFLNVMVLNKYSNESCFILNSRVRFITVFCKLLPFFFFFYFCINLRNTMNDN